MLLASNVLRGCDHLSFPKDLLRASPLAVSFSLFRARVPGAITLNKIFASSKSAALADALSNEKVPQDVTLAALGPTK